MFFSPNVSSLYLSYFLFPSVFRFSSPIPFHVFSFVLFFILFTSPFLCSFLHFSAFISHVSLFSIPYLIFHFLLPKSLPCLHSVLLSSCPSLPVAVTAVWCRAAQCGSARHLSNLQAQSIKSPVSRLSVLMMIPHIHCQPRINKTGRIIYPPGTPSDLPGVTCEWFQTHLRPTRGSVEDGGIVTFPADSQK